MAYQALVIDDNSVCAAVLSGFLKKYGIDTAIEENGVAALQRNDLTSFDLIFTDYLMPELDGLEIAGRIKEKAEEKGIIIPVILCTANVNEVKDREQKNISMILQKPVKQKELECVLEHCVPGDSLAIEVSTDIVEEEESFRIIGLDTAYAIKMSGDVTAYKKILKEYYKTIDKKMNVIRELAQKYEREVFKIEVHGLKSASRLIGALDFAEFCEKLEKECDSYDEETLLGVAEQFISKYGRYRALLEPYVEIEVPETHRQQAETEQVKQWLCELRTALEDFDYDEAEKIMKSVEAYRLPEPYGDVVKKLQEKMDNIDYDGGIMIIDTAL